MLIITVSHDKESLNRRISSFERAGNVVLPASSLLTCLSMIDHNSYDLLVIGATVPLSERQKIVSASKRLHPESKIISVEQKNSRSFGFSGLCRGSWRRSPITQYDCHVFLEGWYREEMRPHSPDMCTGVLGKIQSRRKKSEIC
jgi:hypothetical protein